MMTDKEIELFKELYIRKEHYGKNSIKFYDIISKIIIDNNYKNVLDFGCGKSDLYKKLEEELNIKVFRYDPAIDEINMKPKTKFDFVICSDVLHNVEEKKLDDVIDDISKYSKNSFIYLNCIDHPTKFFDGTKTNRCVHEKKWWEEKLKKKYKCVNIIDINDKTKAMFVTKEKK